MANALTTTRNRARQLAQDGPGNTATSVNLLLTDPGDYNEAITQALRLFEKDRPNVRVVDQVLAASGFRQVLYGTGAMSGLTGLNAWVPDVSVLQAVYYPWLVTSQGQNPVDNEDSRIVLDPGDIWILEFLTTTVTAGQTLRLQFTSRHALTDADATTTVRTTDLDALTTLTGSLVLTIAAVKAAQNTGNTGLPNDIVDRRTQSDVFSSRAKQLRDLYATMVGKGGQADLAAMSATKDLDTVATNPWGYLRTRR